jgi:hypothetical protein
MFIISELLAPFLVCSKLNSNIESTLILSIEIAIKPRILNAIYKIANVRLFFLKIGNKTVAMTISMIALKHKSNTEIMILLEFSEVLVRKSSENKTGPCRN